MASYPHEPRFQRERPLGEVLHDLTTELKDFVSTRIEMLRNEMDEKIQALKTSAPAIVIGAVLAITAWMLFNFAIVALIAMAFEGRSYQYAVSFGIVAVIWALAGAVSISFGYSSIKARGLKPERTMRVLKQDQVWMKTEAKTEL